MRNIKWAHLVIILLATMASHSVLARGGHGHSHGHSYLNLGINLGGYYGPGFYGYSGYGRYGYGGYGFGGYGYPFYYPPSYLYQPMVIAPSTPPVYIQQQPQPVQPQADYWYYCQNPEGYYPYIRNCPDGWLQVAPQPPMQ